MYNIYENKGSDLMEKRDLPIGVFDSGIGGLTVLDKLIEIFPNENFVYVGDTLNLPYGTKTKEELKVLVNNVTKYLVDYPVKAICIACNTATSASHHLHKLFTLPIVGVIDPTAKYALSLGKNILVLGTNVTIDSNEYQNLLDSNLSGGTRYYVRCSEFVDIVEENKTNTKYSFEFVKEKLKSYLDKDIDVIICGCTHFGLLSNEFSKLFPKTKIIECAYPTGKELFDELQKNNLLSNRDSKGEVIINLTKKENDFEKKIEWFKHPIKEINEIKLR